MARQFIDGVVAEAIKRTSTTASSPRSQPLRGGPIRSRGSLSSIRIGSPPYDGTILEGPRGGVFPDRELPRGGISRGGSLRGGFSQEGPPRGRFPQEGPSRDRFSQREPLSGQTTASSE